MNIADCRENLASYRDIQRPVELCLGRTECRTLSTNGVQDAIESLLALHVRGVPVHCLPDGARNGNGVPLERRDSGMMCDMLQQAGKTFIEVHKNPQHWSGLSGPSWEGLTRSLKFASTIGKILVKHQFHLRRLGKFSDEEREEKIKLLNQRSAESGLELILDLKGYYIKAAQTMTGAGVLPKEAENAFSELLDQCPREPFDVVAGIIESELGCSLKSVFRDFDQEAIAAASIGQVHFATLHDGMQVAVKVQYPQVEKYFEIDIRMVSFAMRLAGMGEKVKEVFAEMQKQFKQEFDYRQEAAIMREVAENVLPHFAKKVAIPLPLDSSHASCQGLKNKTLCTKKILTMERLIGKPIREHSQELVKLFAELHGTTAEEINRLRNTKDISELDPNNKVVKAIMNMGEVTDAQSCALGVAVKVRNVTASLLGRFMNCCCSQMAKPQWTQKRIAEPLNGPRLARILYDVHGHEIFQNGLFNSDPHAGNVLMLPDGRLGLLDYGAVMRLSLRKRASIAKLFIAIADEDDNAVPSAFWDCGFKSKKNDPRLALLLAHVFFNRGPHPADMNRLAPKVGMATDPDLITLDKYIRGGAIDDIEEFPGHLVMLQRCAMVLSGIAMELGAGRLSSAAMLKPHAVRFLEERTHNVLVSL